MAVVLLILIYLAFVGLVVWAREMALKAKQTLKTEAKPQLQIDLRQLRRHSLNIVLLSLALTVCIVLVSSNVLMNDQVFYISPLTLYLLTMLVWTNRYFNKRNYPGAFLKLYLKAGIIRMVAVLVLGLLYFV